MSNFRGDGPDGREEYEDHDVAGLAGLYALDALEGDDLERFEAYLRDNADAQIEVDEFRRTAGRLAATTAAPAPSEMRARVLGSLSAVRQDPPQLDVERARRRQQGARRIASIAAAVLLVVAAGTGGYLIGTDGGSSGSGTETASELSTILAHDDATMVDFDSEGGMNARLVYSPTAQNAVVVSNDLPAAPDGHTYELWKVRDGQPVSAGVFSPSDGSVQAPVDAELAAGDTVAVTVEPDGGSETPTTPIVMSAEI